MHRGEPVLVWPVVIRLAAFVLLALAIHIRAEPSNIGPFGQRVSTAGREGDADPQRTFSGNTNTPVGVQAESQVIQDFQHKDTLQTFNENRPIHLTEQTEKDVHSIQDNGEYIKTRESNTRIVYHGQNSVRYLDIKQSTTIVEGDNTGKYAEEIRMAPKAPTDIEEMTMTPEAPHVEPEQFDQLESSILNMFGLSRRPRPRGKIIVPRHMIDLYKLHTGITGDLELHQSRQPSKVYTGNTIRSYYSEDENKKEHTRLKRDVSTSQADRNRQHHKVTLFFNVSHLPENEALKGAELRVFRRKANDSFNNLQENQDFIEAQASINSPYRIDIFEIVHRSSKTNEEHISRLIDTRFIRDLSKSKWETFDIHPAVQKWRSKPSSNLGLEVHFTDMSRQRPSLEHVRLRRSTHDDDIEWAHEQPLLVVYSDDGRSAYFSSDRRRQRRAAGDEENDVDDLEDEENEYEQVDLSAMTADERREYRREQRKLQRDKASKRKNRRKRQCQRRPLYVDFKDVGWADWIIAPPGYDAYFCHGECPFYLPEHLNATNHAIVQTLVHSVDPQAAPAPCCVPTELSDIAMLYLDENDKVVLRNYQDMTVVACGCR